MSELISAKQLHHKAFIRTISYKQINISLHAQALLKLTMKAYNIIKA